MKLMTKEIEEILLNTPFGSTDRKGKDAQVIVKYFNPCGKGTWLITEGELQPDGDWLLYGYAKIEFWEWGYVSLRELENVKLPYGLTIERDLYASGTVRDLCDEKQIDHSNEGR